MARRAKVKPEPPGLQREDWADHEVWQQVASGVKPLARNRLPQPLAPLPKVFRPEGAGAAAYAKAEARQKTPLPHGRLSEKAPPQMDKRLKQRFQRGELPIDARLDLHGLTLANAERALSKLIRDSLAQQKRCLLVITGKGARNADSGVQARGVLRAWLPDYLKRGPWREEILGVTPARQDMGGAGAFYVLLRRQRENT